jgi:signal transduction histidine kinase
MLATLDHLRARILGFSMSTRLHVSMALLNRLVDWFIPAELASDRETHKQARMFLISHLFGPFMGNVVPAALYVLDPDPGYDVAVLAASITAFWAFPFILRAVGRYNLLVLLSVQNLIFCILWSCYFYGGVSSPTLPWVLTIPLLAFFYLGSSSSLRLAVLALFAANLAGFSALYLLGHSPEKDMSAPSLQGFGIVSTIAASLYVTMMAFYYAKILASGVELEGEMKRHLATAAELRRATAEAERASAAKAEFLAKMSHELRTPLNAVIGYSQLLLEDAADEQDEATAADLEKIHSAGHHLLRLINEVLDLSKIEAGKMELFVEPVHATMLIQEIVENCRPLAVNNGNELSLQLVNQLGIITSDAQKVKQALAQILDNAAKFTEKGRITVTAERVTAPLGDEIVVAVQDTGIGMAKDVVPTLFEKFTVADDSTSSKYGGTGLGLALSQRLCHLMGGDISVKSQLGRGSCFTIRLPANITAHRGTGEQTMRAEPDSAEAGQMLSFAA